MLIIKHWPIVLYIMGEREGEKKRLPIWAKILIAAAAVAAVFLTIFLLRDVPPFNQYRFFLKRTINSLTNDKERTEIEDGRVVESEDFAAIDKEVPFKVTRPLWMPEGFELEYVDYKKIADGNFDVSYKYILSEKRDEFIEFNIRDYLPIDTEGFTSDYSEIIIKNQMKVYIYAMGENSNCAEYMNNQGLVISIGGAINQETLIKIIENMS